MNKKYLLPLVFSGVLALTGCTLPSQTRASFKSFLKKKQKTPCVCEFPRKYVQYQGLEAMVGLSERQFNKLSLLTTQLANNSDFRSSIGRELEEDVKDTLAEHGGLVVYKDRKYEINPIKSSYKYMEKTPSGVVINPDANNRYKMSETSKKRRHDFRFHMHAQYKDSTKHNGPSIFIFPYKDKSIGGDVNYIITQIKKFKTSDELVITKLKDRNFNVCYLGGFLGYKEEPIVFLLNLGDYSYKSN